MRHRGQRPSDASRRTSHRVHAAEMLAISHQGRSSSPNPPAIPPLPARSAACAPASAASCSRREAAMSRPEPSAMTTETAGLRSARSIAHNREPVSGGSTNTLRISSAVPTLASWCGYGQQRRPIHTATPASSLPVRSAEIATCVESAIAGCQSRNEPRGAGRSVFLSSANGAIPSHSCTHPRRSTGGDRSPTIHATGVCESAAVDPAARFRAIRVSMASSVLESSTLADMKLTHSIGFCMDQDTKQIGIIKSLYGF